jgi:hypothetical protein
MTTINEKRKYEKPSMKVFELKKQPALLVGSSGDGNLPGMGEPEDI